MFILISHLYIQINTYETCRDGKSRLFGFIGFSSATEAAAAVHYFNKTYIDASRIEVEFAFKYGASEKPRAWSKYSEGTSANKRLSAANRQKEEEQDDGEAAKKKTKKKSKKKGDEEQPESGTWFYYSSS